MVVGRPPARVTSRPGPPRRQLLDAAGLPMATRSLTCVQCSTQYRSTYRGARPRCQNCRSRNDVNARPDDEREAREAGQYSEMIASLEERLRAAPTSEDRLALIEDMFETIDRMGIPKRMQFIIETQHRFVKQGLLTDEDSTKVFYRRYKAGGKIPNIEITADTTLLMRASYDGCVNQVKMILHANAAVDEPRADGRTALMLAAANDQVDCMRLLHSYGARIDYAKPDGGCPLMQAAQTGSVSSLLWLLDKGAHVDQLKTCGTSALMIAADHGHEACVRALIRSGARIDRRNREGADAFFMAVRRAPNDGRALNKRGCVHALLDAGYNASGDAAYCQFSALASQPDLREIEKRGDPWLCLAALNGNVADSTFHVLLDRTTIPLKVLLQTCWNLAAMSLTSMHGDLPPLQWSHVKPFIVSILDHGSFDINAPSEDFVDDGTPDSMMELACAQDGWLPFVQLLSSRGASRWDPDPAPDPDWMPPDDNSHAHDPELGLVSCAEQYAQQRGLSAILEWLKSSRHWRTELHHISILDCDRVRFLLRRGDDLHARGLRTKWHRIRSCPSCRELAVLTPLSCARNVLTAADRHPSSSDKCNSSLDAARMLVRAAEPWSTHTHELFPDLARARAVELLHVGYLLAWQVLAECGETQGFVDCWREFVLPLCVQRPSEGKRFQDGMERMVSGHRLDATPS